MRIIRGLLFFFLAIDTAHAAGPAYSRIIPSLGSTSDTKITAVSTDAAGNVYLTGSTQSLSFPSTAGVVQPNWGGGSCNLGGSPFNPPPTFLCPDAFVVKLDAQGNMVFATYLGGGGYDQGTAIGTDAAGNIYVAGITTRFPTTAGSKYSGGATFIAKLNPTGTALLYTASIPGTGLLPFQAPFEANVPLSMVGIAMVVDAAGNAYFEASGTPGFPITSNALQQSGSLTVGKLDPTGSQLIYATYFGGTGLERVGGIAIDSAGDAYLDGSTSSIGFPVTKGVLQTTLPIDTSGAFVAKLNPSGSGLIYSTLLGGGSFASPSQIRVDSAGDAYVLGSAGGTFPVTPGSFKTTYSTGDAFLAKLNPDATSLIYATFLHTNGLPTTLFDIDAAGNAYFAGQASSDFPATPNALQPCHSGGGSDAVAGELTPVGKLIAATFFGGSSFENVFGMVLISDGSVFLAGVTNSPDFPVTQQGSTGAPGYFVVKLRIQDPGSPGTVCLSAGLQNGANFLEGPVAPGELVTLRGLRLGPDTGVGAQFDSSGKFTTILAGTRVFFDGIPAPLLYVQSQQINAQVPWELNGATSTQVHVESNGASTTPVTVSLAPSHPAFFFGDYVTHQGAILNADGSPNSINNPAARGSEVAIFGTGGGLTNPMGVTGASTLIGPLSFLTLSVSVTIDGKLDAPVLYSGAAPGLSSGIFQINFRLPDTVAAGSLNHTVEVKIGNATSDPQGVVSIAVQ
jgi:uncharacterized protein (TIGR03437 family)